MAQLKCTMLITLGTISSTGSPARIGGWSESVYTGTGTSDFRQRFEALCSARAGLLPNDAAVIGQRYQQVDPVGGSSTGAARFEGRSQANQDVPQMALLTRIGSNFAANIRPYYLRGLPDVMVTKGEFTPTVGYTNALTSWFAALDGWLFLGRDLSKPTAKIVSIAEDGTFVLSNPLTFAVNDNMQVLRTNTAFGGQLGGIFSVKVATDSTHGQFYPTQWTHGIAKGGKMRQFAFFYMAMSGPSARIRGVVVRKVGRPFGQFRGRATKRR